METAQDREHWSKAGGRWTVELVGYALDRFHSRHMRTPTLRELRQGLDDLPSFSTIRRLYGTSGAMFARHGYRVRGRGAQPGNRPALRRNERGQFTAPDRAPRQRTSA